MRSSRKQSGFSKLAELLIVMAVLLILANIITPSFYRYVANMRVKTAIRNLIVLKKALNDMASRCGGYPYRNDATSITEILPIVDIFECGKNNDINDDYAIIVPKMSACPNESLGQMVSATSLDNSSGKVGSGLCMSSCTYGDISCYAHQEANFWSVFVTRLGEDCSYRYGSSSGPDFPGSYQPGWNYRLLWQLGDDPHDQPVGVICGVSRGYKDEAVKIVINTAGYRNGTSVQDGSGMFDIDGSLLATRCPCGPYCKELISGREGCCTPCQGNPGIGYRY